jgi:hypothetical protein
MWGEGPTDRLLTSKEQGKILCGRFYDLSGPKNLDIGDGKLLMFLGVGNGRPGLAQQQQLRPRPGQSHSRLLPLSRPS